MFSDFFHEEGGYTSAIPINYLKPFKDTTYTSIVQRIGYSRDETGTSVSWVSLLVNICSRDTTLLFMEDVSFGVPNTKSYFASGY